MRHTTTRSRVARPVRALLAAVLVMAIGVAPAGVAEPTADQSAPDSVSAEQPALDAGLPSVDSGAAEAADGDSGTDAAAPASPSGAATSPAQSSPAATPSGTAPLGPNPLFPGAVTEDGITVKRDGDVDTIHVHDSEGELWQWGWKASEENIFALSRKGEVTEVLSVTADGRELDREKFGWVNTKAGAFIGFDLNALHTIPPVDVTIKVKTKTKGDYDIAESEDIPTSEEFAKTGYDPKEELDPEGEAQLRAAAPGPIPKHSGMQDQKLRMANKEYASLGVEQELSYLVYESGTWDMTRFALKFDCSVDDTKGIGEVNRIRVVRSGKTVYDETFGPGKPGYWTRNRTKRDYLGRGNEVPCDREYHTISDPGNAFDFQGKPIKLEARDRVIFNFDGPNRDDYAAELWGQNTLTGIPDGNQNNKNWKSITSRPTGNEIVSPTHSTTKKSSGSGFSVVAEEFQLGGKEGGSIQQIKYWYDQSDVKIYAVNQSGNSNFQVKIGNIVDTSQMKPEKKILEDGSVVASTVSATLPTIGWQYGLPGFDDLYVQITTPFVHQTSITGEKNPLEIEFVNGKGEPVYVDVPAGTKTYLQYRANMPNSDRFQPDPTKARIEVLGYPSGKENTEEGPAIETPKDPDETDIPVEEQQKVCSLQGGTVWVSRSAHSNQNNTFNERNTTDLFTQEYGSTNFKKVGSTSNWVYNALSYNPRDGYLYAISQGRVKSIGSTSNHGQASYGVTYDEDPRYPAGHLLRINPTNGVVVDKGKINGIQAKDPGQWQNDLWGGITSGVIRADGKYVFSNSSQSGTKDIYVLGWNDQSKTYSLNASRKTDWKAQSNDYTYVGDGSGNWVYGIRNGSTLLERVNIENGAVQTFDLSTVKDPLGRDFVRGIYGTAWTYGNGNLGFGLNGQQKGYQIQVVDNGNGFSAKIVSQVPMPNSQSNDAASNAIVASHTDLKATKERIDISEDGTVTWKVTVENVGPCASTGFTLNDLVPGDYSDVKVISAESEATPGWIGKNDEWVRGNQVLSIHGPLQKGQKASVRISAKLKEPLPVNEDKCTPQATPPNLVTILGNDGDDVSENNTEVKDGQATVPDDCNSKIQFNLIKVEADGGQTPLNGAKFSIFAVNPDGSRGRLVARMDQPNESGYFAAELEADTSYVLVENQAPAGFSLLTEPVAFKTVRATADNPNATVQVEPGSAGVNLIIDPKRQKPAEVFVQLANVRQGNLPKTGGPGLQAPLALSTVLMLFGAALARRRMTQA